MKPIDSLTPEELRVECAEAMGLTVIQCPFVPANVPRNAKTVFTDEAATQWMMVYPNGLSPKRLPPVDFDANAALTLAGALAEKGWTHEHEGRGDAVAFTFSKSASIHRKAAYGPHAFALALSRAYLAVIRSTTNAQ